MIPIIKEPAPLLAHGLGDCTHCLYYRASPTFACEYFRVKVSGSHDAATCVSWNPVTRKTEYQHFVPIIPVSPNIDEAHNVEA